MLLFCLKLKAMSNYLEFKKKKEIIKSKLSKVRLENNKETMACWQVATALNISGTTVKNYLEGKISDGYLAEAIYEEFKNLNLV